MRFKSDSTFGFQVFAVSGINTISFAIDASKEAREDLLGFAVERFDPTENEQYYMRGFKVFPSVIPNPDESTRVSTFDHPIQSLVWDDFTGKPSRAYTYWFHPLRGNPKNLDRSAPPIQIDVKTEPLYSDRLDDGKATHDIFFNRGVASSQAYSQRFQNKSPKQLAKTSPQKAQEALDWLARDLDKALLKFIADAEPGDTLLCCFYEFRYQPVADALKAIIDNGVSVKLIIDAKENEKTDKKGVFHESFPRKQNLKTIKKAGIPMGNVIRREARWRNIQHNKFMVLLKGPNESPTEVWTGSTNISEGGIFGQTNVGHWVRDVKTAEAFQKYWELLSGDPGGQAGEDNAEVRRKNAKFRAEVEAIDNAPTDWKQIPKGITPIFSPRSGLDVLEMYASLLDSPEKPACITLAFGINKAFKNLLQDHTTNSQIIFMMLDKKDKPNPRSKDAFIAINASNNVYKAWGSFLHELIYQWVKETNARALKFNTHVAYVHSKFLLMDPLGESPMVVTGSANFSDPSTKSNDENMIVIHGDRRVADIYFTEFNRIFNHYYFRSVTEDLGIPVDPNAEESLFLKETADGWLKKYARGKLRQKRVDLYKKMKGFA